MTLKAGGTFTFNGTTYHAGDTLPTAGLSAADVTALFGNPTYATSNADYVFTPEQFGAKGDGTTDDTTAIKSAVNAAVAFAQAHTYYAEVVFDPTKIYLVNGALSQAGATKGNAIIPLPLIDPTVGQKVTLVLRGAREAGALPHWNQTVSQKSGAVLKTTVVGTNDGTFGPASIVGGPTAEQGYGGNAGNLWSNMLVVVDGLRLVAPNNPAICGFDFRGIGEAKVISGSAQVDAPPSTTTSNPTNQWTFGLAMPVTDNNDYCDVLSWSCEGFGIGFCPSEHTNALSIRSIYCFAGIGVINGNVSTPHGARIGYASVEECQNILLAPPSGFARIDIDLLDVENSGKIWDGNNVLYGHVKVQSNGAVTRAELGDRGGWIGSGCFYLSVINGDTLAGSPGTQPAVPASGTAFQNPYLHDAAVTVSGGTVSAVAVSNEASMGITSGTVIVPSFESIKLTYTVAPTWTWMLL